MNIGIIKNKGKIIIFEKIDMHKKKLEIKTINCKFKPRPDFLCTVNSHDLSGVYKQNADFRKGWILGWIPCEEFFEKGEFVAK